MREIERIFDPSDPRLVAYQTLKDRDVARHGGRFIAEGEHVAKRLFASRYDTESVLLNENRVAEMAPLVPASAVVYATATDILHQIVGFKFHSGVLACGLRGPRQMLADNLSSPPEKSLLVVCPELANVENLGSIIRLCSGFGVHALVLGPQSADPFFRQSVRVSMGNVFRLNIFWMQNVVDELRQLATVGFQTVATTLDETAEPLSAIRPADRTALIFGNEAQGLPRDVVDAASRNVTIPMKLGTDSLNVATAAAIFLYHFTQR